MILGNDDIHKFLEKGKLKIKKLQPDSIRENGVDCRISGSMAYDHFVMSRPDTEFVVDTHDKATSDCRFKVLDFKNHIIVPAKTNILLTTEEEFTLPNNVMAFCGLRSTVARMGFVSPITIVDTGFSGTLTIEAFYGGNNPIKLYKGDRFLHVIFAKTLSPVSNPYSGIYSGQTTVRLPKTIN
jgi:dCTP deaminase